MQTFSVVQELSSLVQFHLSAVAVLEEASPLAQSTTLQDILSRHLQDHSDAVAHLYDHLAALDTPPDLTVRVGHEFRDTWQTLWAGGDDHALLVALCMSDFLAMSYIRQLLEDPALLPGASFYYEDVLALESTHFAELTEHIRLMGGDISAALPA